MTPTETLTVSDLAPEVLAFAAEKDVTEYLPGLVDLVHRVYPGRKHRVVLDVDPELCNVKTVLFEVDVGEMDADRMCYAHDEWVAGLRHCCPRTHVSAFGLIMVHDL